MSNDGERLGNYERAFVDDGDTSLVDGDREHLIPDPMQRLIREIRAFGPSAALAYELSDTWTEKELRQLGGALGDTLTILHELEMEVGAQIRSLPRPRVTPDADMPRVESYTEELRGVEL